MTETDPTAHSHELCADPADEFMARFADVLEALGELQHAALNIQCPGCDPDGSHTEAVRVALLERFSLDEGAAGFVLERAADTRAAMLAVLAEPCHHHDDNESGGEGEAA